MIYNTDKIKSGIIAEYEKLFVDLKNEKLKILEIGYLEGEFLRWFKDHFKQSETFGISIYPPCELKDSERIKLLQADQNDTKTLIEIGHTFGKFDIIFDDASHRDIETRNSFNCLWQFVNSKGWYIIEDWGAHYEHLQYGDMGKVISNILINKNGLNISNIRIICNHQGLSLACFQKL